MDYQVTTNRLMRLLRLDTTVFDEVRLDATATVPSIVVAAVATFLAGLGGWLWWTVTQDFGDSGKLFMQSFILGSLFSIALWIVWVLVVYTVLTQLFGAQADIQQLFRTMGLAAAPLAISLLLFIPVLDFGIGLTSLALFFGLSFIAAQATTDAPAGKVLVASAIGFAVWALILGILVTDDNFFAPGMFLMDAANEALESVAELF